MGKKLSIAITLCAAASGFTAAQAQVMCGDVITTSEVLTSNLTCTGFDPALTIQGPGGRLNMRGHTLSCAGSGTEGIKLTGKRARLRNGKVADCRQGVALDGSNHRVSEMKMENNSVNGLLLEGTGHRIIKTVARNNTFEGFCIAGDGGNVFRENRATNNGENGFDTLEDDTYISNVATGNANAGFVVRSDNLLEQNVARENGFDGFFVREESSTLTRNSARRNLDDGIDIQLDSSNNALSKNKASGNGSADLEGDGGFDLEDDNSDCDNNAWTDNTGTRNQACIQ